MLRGVEREVEQFRHRVEEPRNEATYSGSQSGVRTQEGEGSDADRSTQS